VIRSREKTASHSEQDQTNGTFVPFTNATEIRVAMPQVSHRLSSDSTPVEFKRHHDHNNPALVTHGHARIGAQSRTYRSWAMMLSRCRNSKDVSYQYYGGRGLKVCSRWESFENFLKDMGERPKGRTIDRYPDKNGNYEPGNCRWATPSQQSSNRNPNGYLKEVLT
jgi:hypothetical protein